MKVAHVMAGAPAGGAELFYERLVAAQHEAGDAILPVVRSDRNRAARLCQGGTPPLQLPFGGPFDLLTRPRLRRALRHFAPELVMAWMSRAAVFTPSGPYILAGRLGGYYDLRRFHHCDHLVANTKGLLDWILQQGWPRHRVHHLPNFSPDLAGATPAALPTPRGAPVILALGRLHRNKAFDILIRALPHLPGVHAVIAGEGPERAALEALAAAQRVTGRLHLLGWRHDQGALLAASTVLACPSRQEPLGNVVLEAFSAGVPVVATESEGPSEVIRRNETGLLVPLEHPEALARALAQLIEDRTLATRLAAAARTEYEAQHAEAPVITQWRTTLRHLSPAGR